MHWKVLATGRTGGAEAAFARVKGGGGSGSEVGGWFGMKEGVNRVMAVGFGVLLGVVLAVIAVLGWMERMGETGGAVQPTKSRASLRGSGLSCAGGSGKGGGVLTKGEVEELLGRLESESVQWWEDFDSFHAQSIKDYEWELFSRARVDSLSLEEVQSILEYLRDANLPASHHKGRFAQALFWSWGKQDPEAALAFLEEAYQPELSDESDYSMSVFGSGHSRFQQEILVGWALVDGLAALEFSSVLNKPADATLVHRVDVNIEKIFESFAEGDPRLAWDYCVNENELDLSPWWIKGLPANQDWKAIAAKVEGAGEERGSVKLDVASRWFVEDPQAALLWFENEMLETEEVIKVMESLDEFFDRKEVSDDEFEEVILYCRETFLDVLFYESAWESGLQGQAAVRLWAQEILPKGESRDELVLGNLLFADTGSDPFAVYPELETVVGLSLQDEGLGYNARWEVNPKGAAFVPLIASLPDEAARRHYLAFVERLEPRVFASDPFWDSDVFVAPNYSLQAAKEILARIPLTSEERERAERAFARVEAEEAEIRRD